MFGGGKQPRYDVVIPLRSDFLFFHSMDVPYPSPDVGVDKREFDRCMLIVGNTGNISASRNVALTQL